MTPLLLLLAGLASAQDTVEPAAPAADTDEGAEPAAEAPAPAADTDEGAEPAATPSEARIKADAPPGPHKFRWQKGTGFVETWGHLREIGSVFPDYAVDAEGGELGQDGWLDQRLRVGASGGFKGVWLATEWDLLTGSLAGDPWDIPVSLDARDRDEVGTAWTLEGQVPRRASLSAVIPSPGPGAPLGLIDVGLMPSHRWGLGILANGGESETLFGRVDRGDRMLRARFTFAPFVAKGIRLPLFVTVAFDRVVEDDTARWADGQDAYHVIGSVLWNDPKGRRGGVFYTYRTQVEPTDAPRPTDVHVIDGYVDVPVTLTEDGWVLRLAAEGALIAGRTERVLTYADTTGTDGLSGGVAAEIDARSPTGLVSAHLRTGWTSSTGDPDAGALHDFTFDPNYNVGIVLFDELLGSVEAATYAQLDDPDNAGRPPDGADQLVTEGSVRRATYLNPAVVVRPLGWLDVGVGYLAAWSTGPIAQPFTTYRAGGIPTNHLGEPTGDDRFLGHELDAKLAFGLGKATERWWFRPSLDAQLGVAFPGEALGGGTLVLGRVTARVDW